MEQVYPQSNNNISINPCKNKDNVHKVFQSQNTGFKQNTSLKNMTLNIFSINSEYSNSMIISAENNFFFKDMFYTMYSGPHVAAPLLLH